MFEVKFKGIDEFTHKWVFGFYEKFEMESGYVSAITSYDGNDSSWSIIEEDSVGMYTTFKDVKEVEIYSGDIIFSTCHSPSHYLIEFIDGAFCATFGNDTMYPIDLVHFYSSLGCCIEIVGNKRTHPSLMKKVIEGEDT